MLSSAHKLELIGRLAAAGMSWIEGPPLPAEVGVADGRHGGSIRRGVEESGHSVNRARP